MTPGGSVPLSLWVSSRRRIPLRSCDEASPRMLLWVVKWCGEVGEVGEVGHEAGIDFAGEVAFEAADEVFFGHFGAGLEAGGHVGAGELVAG